MVVVDRRPPQGILDGFRDAGVDVINAGERQAG